MMRIIFQTNFYTETLKNYAVGHGCAATWTETQEGVYEISTSIFPQYEVKPIVPSKIDGVSLDMYKMSDVRNMEEIIAELKNSMQ